MGTEYRLLKYKMVLSLRTSLVKLTSVLFILMGIGCKYARSVSAGVKSPKADGFACPEIDGYNDQKSGKGKRLCSCSSVPAEKPEAPPKEIWSVYQFTNWLRIRQRVFFVRSGEQSLCPCCNGDLKVIGSRRRRYIDGYGSTVILVIRRLKCRSCKKHHHELPDLLVPYKRYGSESIEAVVSLDNNIYVSADESTIRDWRRWFKEISDYLLGCLVSILIQQGLDPAEVILSTLPRSPLQRIYHLVGDAPGWLARVVRPIANFNLWPQTRSAFLSA